MNKKTSTKKSTRRKTRKTKKPIDVTAQKAADRILKKTEKYEKKIKIPTLSESVSLLATSFNKLSEDISQLKEKVSLAESVGECVLFEFAQIMWSEGLISQDEKYNKVKKAIINGCKSYRESHEIDNNDFLRKMLYGEDIV